MNKFALAYTLLQYGLQALYKCFSIFFWSYYFSSLNNPKTEIIEMIFYVVFNPFQVTLNFMICMGLAALFFYQGKAATNSRKKININMISNGFSSGLPAPHESEF